MKVHKLPGVPERPLEAPSHPPMVYVSQEPNWEYRHLSRGPKEDALSEEELNALGGEGWELVGVIATGTATHFYFKRPTR